MNKSFFLKMDQSRPLFHLFSVFPNKQYNFYNKCPSSICCQDFNPHPFEQESSPITTRPGLTPNEKKFLKRYVCLLYKLMAQNVFFLKYAFYIWYSNEAVVTILAQLSGWGPMGGLTWTFVSPFSASKSISFTVRRIINTFYCSTRTLGWLSGCTIRLHWCISNAISNSNHLLRRIQCGKWYLRQRTVTYFVRGNITLRLTSCLTS